VVGVGAAASLSVSFRKQSHLHAFEDGRKFWVAVLPMSYARRGAGTARVCPSARGRCPRVPGVIQRPVAVSAVVHA